MMCFSISTIVAVPPPNVELPYRAKTEVSGPRPGDRTIGASMLRNRSRVRSRDQPVRPSTLSPTIRTKVWLELDGAFVIGEGGVDLLRAIDRSRSLTRAAQTVGWSYRHAWGYLRNAENQLRTPLVATSPGKGGERGTTLTPAGRDILRRLGRARRIVTIAARKEWS